MNNKLKKYEWIIYFVMVIATLMILVVPSLILLALMDGNSIAILKNSYTDEFLKNENIIKIIAVVSIIMTLATWLLIEGLLINLLKIIKSIRNRGVFIEENKKSVEKMCKYLVVFGITYLIMGVNIHANTSRINSIVREISSGVGSLSLSGITIEVTVYTIILTIIYILIKVVVLVFSEAIEIKEINNEIV
ncbi:MAG: hypothetical protein ACRDA5_12365 [Clostridium sp.]